MSAFLIGFTVLVVFVLFYISKRLICSGPNFSNTADDEDSCEVPVWTSGTHHHYCDTNDSDLVNPEYLSDSSNNNNNNNNHFHPTPNHESNRTGGGGILWPAIGRHSQVENRLRSQVFHMILAENEYRRLEIEASRLARLLSSQQGINPDDYIQNIRNELSPLTSLTTFRSPPAERTGGGRGEIESPRHCYRTDFINYDNNNDTSSVINYQENNRESQLPHVEISNEQSPVRNGNNIFDGNVDSNGNESTEKFGGQPIETTCGAELDECNNNNKNNNESSNLTDNKNCNV